jgi:glycogen operon protein
MGRTQHGNNNAYCQDNAISWIDWTVSDADRAFGDFVRRLIALRRRYPVLRRNRFMTGVFNAELGLRDVDWFSPSGTEMRTADWNDAKLRCFGMLLEGRAQTSGVGRPGTDSTLLVLINGGQENTAFRLPGISGGRRWASVFDTAMPERSREQIFRIGEAYLVASCSVSLFALQS